MDGWWTFAAGTAALNDRLLKGAWDRDRHATLLPGNPFSWMDHLVRPPQDRLRDRPAERLRGLEIDHQLYLRRFANSIRCRFGSILEPIG
jgi:hypothetical protein